MPEPTNQRPVAPAGTTRRRRRRPPITVRQAAARVGWTFLAGASASFATAGALAGPLGIDQWKAMVLAAASAGAVPALNAASLFFRFQIGTTPNPADYLEETR